MSNAARHPGATTTMSNGVFDYSATLDRLGGDVELFTDLVRFFLEDADGLLARLHDAVKARDARRVEMAAHALKGLCANFDARRAVTAAAAAEDSAQAGRLDPPDVDIDEIDAAVRQLKAALTPFLQTARNNN